MTNFSRKCAKCKLSDYYKLSQEMRQNLTTSLFLRDTFSRVQSEKLNLLVKMSLGLNITKKLLSKILIFG